MIPGNLITNSSKVKPRGIAFPCFEQRHAASNVQRFRDWATNKCKK